MSKTPAADEKSEATKPSSGFSFGIGSTTSVKEADKKEDEEQKKPTTSLENGLSKTPAADEKSEATKPATSSGGESHAQFIRPRQPIMGVRMLKMIRERSKCRND